MTLERSIRIIAGTFVLVSALLGYFVHHYWLFFTCSSAPTCCSPA